MELEGELKYKDLLDVKLEEEQWWMKEEEEGMWLLEVTEKV